MKVVCESCQAKYQVPDERVAGKRLKIRCKRCGESVLIRGDLLDGGHNDEGATVLSPQMGSGVEWFGSVDGDVSGPFNVVELGTWLADNPLGWDAYVWREGVSEWVPAHDCAEVVAAVGGGRTVVAQGRDEDQPTRMFESNDADDLTQAREPFMATHAALPPPRASVPPRSSVAPMSASAVAAPRGRSSSIQAPMASAGASAAQAQYPSQAPGSVVRSNPSPSFPPAVPSPSAPPQMRPPSSIRPRGGSLPPSASTPGASLLSRAASIPPTSKHSVPPPSPRAPSLPPSSVRGASMPPSSVRGASMPPSSVRGASMPPSSVRGASMPPSSVRPPSAPQGQADESIMFSTQNLRHVAASHSQPPGAIPSSRPGMAAGEGSGLVDIGALSSIANQQAAAAQRASRPPALPPSGNYVRVDSIAPGKSRGSALPLVVFAGFAMISAALFAGIWITRSASVAAAPAPAGAAPTVIAAVMQPLTQAPVAAAQTAAPEVVQPSAAVAPAVQPAPQAEQATKAPEVAVAAPTPVVERAIEPAEPKEHEEVAVEKRASKRHSRGARTAAEDQKDATPEEPKSKEKEKAPPPSLDDVMLADKSEPAEESPAEEPAPAKASSGDIDDLLADKPAKAPEKDRSFDDLLDGAVTKKSAPAAAVAAEALPEAPSRDETLTAMRGVESDVKGCDATGELSGSTVQVQIQVSGGSGKVTSANVQGASGPVAACISKAARGAEFPRFSKPSFGVKFPYRF